jgi:hypothetical protein
MLTKIYPSYPNWRRVKINPGIVSIENIASLRAHIITFNRNFLRHKVSVEEEDEVRKKCLYVFNKIKGAIHHCDGSLRGILPTNNMNKSKVKVNLNHRSDLFSNP